MAATRNTRIHQAPALQMRAEVVPSSFNADKRTVDITWTTGARVLRGGGWFSDPFHEELSLDPSHVRMGRLQSGAAPLLDSHRSYGIDSVIGVVDSARLDPGGKSGSATVRFDSGERGEDAFRKVREGILRNVSVGYRVHKMEQVESARERDDKTAVFRVTDWEPHEISMVPIGADAGAGTRAESASTNPCEFTFEERDMDPKPTATATTTNPAPAPAPTPAQAPTFTEAQRAEVATAERERISGIRRAARALGRPEAEADKAIEDGVSLDKYRELAIEERAKAAPEQGGHLPIERGGRIQAGVDARDKWHRGAMAWLLLRSGSEVAEIVKRHGEKGGEKVDLDPGEFRGMRMLDLARSALDINGISHRGLGQREVFGAALTARSDDSFFTHRAPGASTSDFPLLLENVLHKVLLASYGITPDTWRNCCTIGSVVDFRPSPRYRLGSFSVLDSLTENGELQNKSIPDAEKQSLTAATKGNIIALDRQALINDDLSAFSRLAMMFGRAAALSIESDFYALLALNSGLGPTMGDSHPLFDAAHTNLGTGSALTSSGIDGDRVVMKSQKDPSGNELLDIRPSVLLVPASLGGQARQVNTSQYDFDALSTKNPWVPNKVGGLFNTIVDTARLTGTRRYLFADPAIYPVIEVAFLDGQQQPYMEMRQGWRVDGVEWKIRLDYVVGAIDFRGAVTNAGA